MPAYKNTPIKFAITFIILFLAFYYFNIAFFGITSPGNYYSEFLAHNLNYISLLRSLLLHSSAFILNCLGYSTKVNNYELLVVGHSIIKVVYTCLGLGVLSFFTAFTLAYPKPYKQKLVFLMAGIIVIEIFNIIRFVILALYWNTQKNQIVDHHTIFNVFIYIIITIALYFWVKADATVNNQHAKN